MVAYCFRWLNERFPVSEAGEIEFADIAQLAAEAEAFVNVFLVLQGVKTGVYDLLRRRRPKHDSSQYLFHHTCAEVEVANFRLAYEKEAREQYQFRQAADLVEREFAISMTITNDDPSEEEIRSTTQRATYLEINLPIRARLDSETRIGALTMETARLLWTHLVSEAVVGEYRSGQIGGSPLRKWTSPGHAVHWLAEASGVERGDCEVFIKQLTWKKGMTYELLALEPLLEIGGELYLPPSQVLCYNFERNYQTLHNLRTRGGGTAGRRQGLLGERSFSDIFTGQGIEKFRQVKVYKHDGNDATDLDLVLLSQHEGYGVVMSIITALPPDGYVDSARLDAKILKKQRQWAEIRAAVEDGSYRVSTKKGHLNLLSGEWLWVVVGPDRIPYSRDVRDHPVPFLSADMLRHTAAELVQPMKLSDVFALSVAKMRNLTSLASARVEIHDWKCGTVNVDIEEPVWEPALPIEQMIRMIQEPGMYGAEMFDEDGRRLPSLRIHRLSSFKPEDGGNE